VRDPLKPLGAIIRRRRLELGLSQEQLAEKADLHFTYISGIERGLENVSILKLAKIAAGLKTRVRDLVQDI